MSSSTRTQLDQPRASEPPLTSALSYNPIIISINTCGMQSSWPDLVSLVHNKRPMGVIVQETLMPAAAFSNIDYYVADIH
mmetsp:Transcript_30096/g.52883  ORF Transcript_30096/g.52883 Transcript_30096/m.52883 type:complete len:80 (+) Transcript_30096:411-650(+)